MAVYADTSALVTLVVAETETGALMSWLRDGDRELVAADLVRTELLRTVRRSRRASYDSCDAGAHVAWVPDEMRSGRRTRAMGPVIGSAASKISQCDTSLTMSDENVSR